MYVCINNHFHRRPLHGAAERLLDFKRLLFQKNIVDDFDESWVRVKLCIIHVHMFSTKYSKHIHVIYIYAYCKYMTLYIIPSMYVCMYV